MGVFVCEGTRHGKWEGGGVGSFLLHSVGIKRLRKRKTQKGKEEG